MGFLEPLALLGLPLGLLPLFFARRARQTGEPLVFSSLYLLYRAHRAPARQVSSRSRWLVLLRILIVVLLVLAAARPVGPGGGDPAAHFPTRAVVAVDVSASVGQLREGTRAWDSIGAWADTLFAWAGPDDRIALAAVADGIVRWWEAPPAALRDQLGQLGPTARASDWPRVMAALQERAEEGTETYLLTDGSRGARSPEMGSADTAAAPLPAGHRVVRAWEPPPEPNRGLVGVEWAGDGRAALVGDAWGPGSPPAAVAGRQAGARLAEPRPLPLVGSAGPATWAMGDTATFAFREGDRFPADDRLFVAAAAGGGPYRVVRWEPRDGPPEPGALFWEAALGSSARGPRVERVGTLAALATRAPDLALLPIRAYRADEASLLAEAAAAGTRLLFAPACPDPACVPSGDWLPAPGLAAPRLAWRLGDPGRQTTLLARPPNAAGVAEHLLARAPVRGALSASGDDAEWTWDLASGEPALWVRGSVAVWLVPLGPPVTRLGTTPVFPLVAESALAAWDPAWSAGGAGRRPGQAIPVPSAGAFVRGPLHAGEPAQTWNVAPGGPPPRPERAGLYRIEIGGVREGGRGATFVAVNGDPAEGDLTPIPAALWSATWGPSLEGAEWRAAAFPRRRGPELWPWALVLSLAALAAEAFVRRRAASRTAANN